jgi:acyl-CoA synthetase (AMP-forming)/AMP-acid ligase II
MSAPIKSLIKLPLLSLCHIAGALHTHGSLAAHIHALVTSWEWQEDDRILHCLPLHHVHGIINALYCAHAIGATVELQPKFSPKAVWAALMVCCHSDGVLPSWQTSAQHWLCVSTFLPQRRHRACARPENTLELSEVAHSV